MTTRQTLRLHKSPDDHLRFVSWINSAQDELEELVQTVTGKTASEDTDLALLDKYASLQNFFGDLRAAVLDHAWVAGKLKWTK